jgi:hypothetical protein
VATRRFIVDARTGFDLLAYDHNFFVIEFGGVAPPDWFLWDENEVGPKFFRV